MLLRKFDHGGREITRLYKFVYENRHAFAFGIGELAALRLLSLPLPLGLRSTGMMGELRLLPAERIPDLDMQRKGGQPFHRARDMRYPHMVVINDMREMVRGVSV